MSLAETITVSDGTSNKTYSTTIRAPRSTTRVNLSAPNSSTDPRTLQISNQVVTRKGMSPATRVLIAGRDQSTFRNVAGVPEIAKVNITLERPQIAEFTDSRLTALLFETITATIGTMAATPANVALALGKLLAGES